VGTDDGADERLEATVRGRVQGVGFRVFVAREAWRRSLTGWVRNDADGAVHVVAEGPAGELDDLLEALRHGPPGAGVREVQATRGPAVGLPPTFEIRPGGHGGD
jgi:acylphosphatase